MPDHSDKFRQLASDWIAIARNTTDPGSRVFLLTMAQKWYDLADGPTINFESLAREFNDRQTSDMPMMQQQQIQQT